MSNDNEFENSQESHGADNDESETLTVEQLQEKNKQLFARLKKAEADVKTAKEANRTAQAGENTQAQIPTEQVERLTLKVDGYHDDEIAKIMELGGIKALSNPLVKRAVDLMRDERKAESAQVDTEGATSDFSRKYSEADLRKMSASELEKILPSV
jgi:hypothetical protein